jgi:uncharacterized protein YlxW (UPF0749 family)
MSIIILVAVGILVVKYIHLSLKEEKDLYNRIVELRVENSELQRQLDTANYKLRMKK